MQKNSFVLFTKYERIFTEMSDRQAGVLIKAIFHYVATGETMDGLNDVEVKTAFKFVKLDLDYNNKKYIDTCNQNALNGKKGGAPKGNNNAQKQPKQPTACFSTETTDRLKNNPKQPKTTENKHNDVDNDVDVDNDIDKTTITPLPPLKGKEQLEFVSDQFKPIFNRWLDYKREKKQTYKSKLSLQQCYKQLLELSNNNVAIAEKVVNQSIANNWAGLFPLKETKKAVPVNDAVNNILEFMLANYEDKGLAGNPTLKERYVNKWSKTASDLINACGGNVEQAKEMIKLYERKQTGEWFLWGVLNDYCGLYEELKRRKLCPTR